MMDIDFALVLVVLVFVTGILWLFDLVFLASRRSESASEPVIIEYAKSFFPVLTLVLVLRSFLVEPFQIPSASMVPTLREGDFILVNKFVYGIRLPVIGTKIFNISEPKRGDVMVFFPPTDTRYFIKRVIGVPGDQISYHDKMLYVNGKPMSQTLLAELPPSNPRERLIEEDLTGVKHQIRHDLLADGNKDASVTVEPGHYFMMGDNRDNSYDSRYWGQVPEDHIVGKAFAIWMHWSSFLSVPSFSRAGVIQ